MISLAPLSMRRELYNSSPSATPYQQLSIETEGIYSSPSSSNLVAPASPSFSSLTVANPFTISSDDFKIHVRALMYERHKEAIDSLTASIKEALTTGTNVTDIKYCKDGGHHILYIKNNTDSWRENVRNYVLESNRRLEPQYHFELDPVRRNEKNMIAIRPRPIQNTNVVS